MNLRSVTFEIPVESLAILDEIASNLEVDRDTVLREAVADYLAEYAKLKAEAEEAARQIEAGNFLTQTEMEARFESRIRTTKAA